MDLWAVASQPGFYQGKDKKQNIRFSLKMPMGEACRKSTKGRKEHRYPRISELVLVMRRRSTSNTLETTYLDSRQKGSDRSHLVTGHVNLYEREGVRLP